MGDIKLLIASVLAFIAGIFIYGKKKELDGEKNIKDEQAHEQLEGIRDAKKRGAVVARMPSSILIKRLLERKTK